MVLLSAPYALKLDSLSADTIDFQNFVQSENDLLKDLVYSDRSNLYGLCGINPTWEFAMEETVRCIEELGLEGVKWHFQGNQIDITDTLTRKSISVILDYLSEKDAVVLIHLNGWDLTNAEGLGKQFIANFLSNDKKQTIVFAHTGGPGGFTKFTVDFLNVFHDFFKTNAFSANKRIYFELSGTILTRSYPGKVDSIELKKIIGSMGSEHFLFGSDFPYKTGNSYQKELVEELGLDPKVLKEIITRDIFFRE